MADFYQTAIVTIVILVLLIVLYRARNPESIIGHREVRDDPQDKTPPYIW